MKMKMLGYLTLFAIVAGLNHSSPALSGNDNELQGSSIPIEYRYSTDEIVFMGRQKVNDYIVEYYENHAYTCGLSGYQTFTVAYPDDGARITESRPLWIRFHGGGTGVFDPDGKYKPRYYFPRLLDQESPHMEFRDEQGLVSYIRGDDAGFRFLMVSMCDHDMYSGIGTVDINNPFNPADNGDVRMVDGHLSTFAAVDFTIERFATSHIFAHGTSAGSVGAVNLAITLGRAGKKISGVVADSGIISGYWGDLARTGCQRIYTPEIIRLLKERISPFTVDKKALPEAAIANGDILTPLYVVWSSDDWSTCGRRVVRLKKHDGTFVIGEATKIIYSVIAEAIDRYNPGGSSQWRELCVDDPAKHTSKCDRHSPTIYSAPDYGGDRGRGGEDYNHVIYQWVRQRLADPLPDIK